MLSFLRKHRNETGTHGTQHQRPMEAIHFDPNCTRHDLPQRMGGPCAGEKHRAGALQEKRTRSESIFGVTGEMGGARRMSTTYTRISTAI